MSRFQDGPPAEGYAPVRFQRRLPTRGPPMGVIVLGLGAMMGFGWYRLAQSNQEQREAKREVRAARLAIAPFLQTEDDLIQSYLLRETTKLEAVVMSEVPGWEAGKSVYNGNRYLPPTIRLF
eukprot:c3999_g1_i1.p1 GENE.c3999_g1_i1~~c3999_g1_i1.p1  ORF type:complete len:122 (-),score=15.49 c3999_g1_i1:44-409(-)